MSGHVKTLLIQVTKMADRIDYSAVHKLMIEAARAKIILLPAEKIQQFSIKLVVLQGIQQSSMGFPAEETLKPVNDLLLEIEQAMR